MSVARASAPSSWARTFRPSFSVLTLPIPATLSFRFIPSILLRSPSRLLHFLPSSISLRRVDPSLSSSLLHRAFYTLLSNGSKLLLVSVHDQPSFFLEMAITLLILFLEGRKGEIDRVRGGKWKFRFLRRGGGNSILQSFAFINFFPSNWWSCSFSGRKSRKFSFSRIGLFSNGIRGEV